MFPDQVLLPKSAQNGQKVPKITPKNEACENAQKNQQFRPNFDNFVKSNIDFKPFLSIFCPPEPILRFQNGRQSVPKKGGKNQFFGQGITKLGVSQRFVTRFICQKPLDNF